MGYPRPVHTTRLPEGAAMTAAVTYATILVHLAEPARAPRVLAVAGALARDGHDRGVPARIIGLAVVPPVVVVPAIVTIGTVGVLDEHRTAYAAELPALRTLFEATLARQGISGDWREADAGAGEVVDQVLVHGRQAEIVVASARDPAWAHAAMFEQPERLVTEAGRPVLLVPNTGDTALPMRRVTVAWNARREAARAVFDALPLLTAATDVDVVWVAPEREPDVAGDLPAAEICRTLAHRGVRCTASHVPAGDLDVGERLLQHARAFGAHALVMGAYGHTRLYQLILGGASRHVLANTTIPVLMSH
jgi:nucleotide-binding universal stress UspA family protein